jgi:hypothetical protein
MLAPCLLATEVFVSAQELYINYTKPASAGFVEVDKPFLDCFALARNDGITEYATVFASLRSNPEYFLHFRQGWYNTREV